MTIEHAILGILSIRPMTGYDLKKVMQDSTYLHWSGNNNQIYKALLGLQEDGYVYSEVQHQESAPTKKQYTITQRGLNTLTQWSMLEPEAPECKKSFLAQLAFSGTLGNEELLTLITGYENTMWAQLQMCKERARRGGGLTPRSKREALLWEMIDNNIETGLTAELDWIRSLKERLSEAGMGKEGTHMQYEVHTQDQTKFIEVRAHASGLRTTQDAMDLISLCAEHDCGLMLLHEDALSTDFFQLKTGVAGEILQKLVNYRIRAAFVLKDISKLSVRFKEMMLEANKSNQYRFFDNRADAELWLMKGV